MKMHRVLFGALAIAVTSAAAVATQEMRNGEAAAATAVVDRLTETLNRGAGQLAEEAWLRERERLTNEIRGEVTRVLQAEGVADAGSAGVTQLLRRVLHAHTPTLEYTDPPTARQFDKLRGGPAFVVSYAVVRPPHFDSSRVSGFRAIGGQLQQTAVAGQEFEGYTMFTRVLGREDGEVACILAAGQAQMFNGAKFRLRVYEFDGATFRTLWEPSDVFDAQIDLKGDAFTLTYRERPRAESTTHRYQCRQGSVDQIG